LIGHIDQAVFFTILSNETLVKWVKKMACLVKWDMPIRRISYVPSFNHKKIKVWLRDILMFIFFWKNRNFANKYVKGLWWFVHHSYNYICNRTSQWIPQIDHKATLQGLQGNPIKAMKRRKEIKHLNQQLLLWGAFKPKYEHNNAWKKHIASLSKDELE
jgi:hypothetical protein